MKCATPRAILRIALLLAVSASAASAQRQKVRLGDNAALRYWEAFAQMQDRAISDEEVRELGQILNGKIPYEDAKFRDLVEKNKPALETMARGTTLTNCDWGLEYAEGLDVPLSYPAKAVALARLNILYAFHLQSSGDREGAVRALVAGLRFSHDIANGAPLMIATLLAKDSLAKHLVAIASVLHTKSLAPEQRMFLQKALTQLGPDPLDWKSPLEREVAGLKTTSTIHSRPWPCSTSPVRIARDYAHVIDDPAALPEWEKFTASQPEECRDFFPNLKRLLVERQDLNDQLRETLSLLQ